LSEFSTIAYIIKSSLLTDSAQWSLLHPRYFIPQDACVAILALALRQNILSKGKKINCFICDAFVTSKVKVKTVTVSRWEGTSQAAVAS
jgi:hypothetical protein